MATAADGLEAYLAPFGLSSFRPGQREVIETVLAGQDCLCVMPTGGGKSLCYQLPAIAQDGVTLVISPLIALMKDQVDTLEARGLPATLINSTLSPDELSRRLENLAAGQYRLVYVVPERFRSPRFLDAVRASRLRLLAVDEAHCVSEWGHDFRPDYARLGRFRAQMGNPPTIALTATATDAVRRDIVEMLGLNDPKIFITGFARPNLFYAVQVCSTDRDKDAALFRFLDENPGSGIVYASTRKRSEELAERIAARTGRRTTVYHAGLPTEERQRAQEDFMQGRTEIAVATMAFGMGIDKADIRFVVHYNLPGSLEAYYQEAGRAGRDGQPARCLLLFGSGDRNIHEFFIESAYPSRDVVKRVYSFLRGLDVNPIEMTQQEVKESLGLQIGAEGIGACEKLLESAGVLERLEATENMAAVRLNSELSTLVDLVPQQAKTKRQVLRAVERLVGAQRNAWYYFQPRDLLRQLEDLSSGDLSRHLRELASLASFDYVPPFRGRAIHLRDDQRRFEELEIDFETLERHKAAEYERIEHVLRFARSRGCRQQEILHYFGERDSSGCGNCDNCHGAAGQARMAKGPASPKVLEAARIVLSGVARVSQRRSGCGKTLLAQMFCGSNAKPVVRNRLDKLSTFGLLAHLKQPEVVQLIDALLAAGLLDQNEIEPFRPVVQLTPRGMEVMSGRAEAALALPAALRKKLEGTAAANGQGGSAPEQDSPAAPADTRLREQLQVWRDETRKAQNLPAYMVLANSVLDELASLQPQTIDELLSIKGFGESKARQYGEQLLRILAPSSSPAAPPVTTEPLEHEPQAAPQVKQASIFADEASEPAPAAAPSVAAATREPEVAPPPAASTAEASRHPTHYWTWRLLNAGFTPAECAEIRGLADDVVRDHALRAAGDGHPIDAAWFMPGDVIARIEDVLGARPPSRIRPLLEKMPRGTRYEDVQLVLKSRRAGTDGA